MLKKYLTFTLVCLLLITANASLISAQTQTSKEASAVAAIKETVAKRGTGENKRVQVKKHDGTKLKGYISQADEDSFTLTDSKTKQSTEIAYSDVAKIKNRSSKGDKIALIAVGSAAAVVAVVIIGFLVVRCQNEGGC